MTTPPGVQLVTSDWTHEDLAALFAMVAGCEPADVCRFAVVISVHRGDGSHGLFIPVSNGLDHRSGAVLLQHAALHLTGRCRRCRREEKRQAGTQRREGS